MFLPCKARSRNKLSRTQGLSYRRKRKQAIEEAGLLQTWLLTSYTCKAKNLSAMTVFSSREKENLALVVDPPATSYRA